MLISLKITTDLRRHSLKLRRRRETTQPISLQTKRKWSQSSVPPMIARRVWFEHTHERWIRSDKQYSKIDEFV